MIVQWIILLLTCASHADELQGMITYPRLVESRSEDGSQVVKIDPHLTLTLERSSIFQDDLEVSDLEDGAYVTKIIPSKTYSYHLMQDRTHFASLMFYVTARGVMLVGIINVTHVIQPDPIAPRDLKDVIPHRVQRISQHVEPTVLQRKGYKDDSRVSSRKDKAETKPRKPKVYKLEMAIVTDNWAMKNIEKRSRADYEAYYVTVVNAVVLRLSLLRNPVIILKLVGVYNGNNYSFFLMLCAAMVVGKCIVLICFLNETSTVHKSISLRSLKCYFFV